MKPIKMWKSILVLGIWTIRLVSAEPILPQQLNDLVAEAVQNNPEVLAASEKVHAMSYTVSAASSWPDPMLSFGVLNLPADTWYFNQEPMTGKQIRMAQQIPFPGKSGLKGEIAAANAEFFSHQQEELKLDIGGRVKKTWFSLGYLSEALRQNQAVQELIQTIKKSAQSRYQTGQIGLTGVLDVEQFENQLYQQQLELQAQQEKMAAEMNYLLQRTSNFLFPIISVPEIIENSLDADSLLQWAEQNRPVFGAWRARIKKHEKTVSLARKKIFPDVTVGVAYTQRDELRNGGTGVDFWSGTVGISLPLFAGQKQLPEIEQHKRELQSIKLTYAAVVSQLHRDIQRQLVEHDKNYELLKTYQQRFLPQAQDAFSSSLAAYQNGKLDLQDLVLRQKQVLEYELAVTRFRTNVWLNRVELEQLTGVSIEGLGLSKGEDNEK